MLNWKSSPQLMGSLLTRFDAPDSFHGDVLKDNVYHEPTNTVLELKAKAHGQLEVLKNVLRKWDTKSMEIRLCFVSREEYGHFEYLLN